MAGEFEKSIDDFKGNIARKSRHIFIGQNNNSDVLSRQEANYRSKSIGDSIMTGKIVASVRKNGPAETISVEKRFFRFGGTGNNHLSCIQFLQSGWADEGLIFIYAPCKAHL